MPSSPLISVVVPAYDAARFLPATLEGVVAQTEQRWECLVVDDGSTDDTYEVASRFAGEDRRFRAMRIEHGGSSRARNEGFRLSDTGVALSSRSWTATTSGCRTRSRRCWRDWSGMTALVGSHGLASSSTPRGSRYAPGEYAEAGRDRWGLEGRRLIRWPPRPADDVRRPDQRQRPLPAGAAARPPRGVRARGAVRRGAGGAGGLGHADPAQPPRRPRFRERRDPALPAPRREQGAKPTTPGQAWLVRCIGFHSPENSPAQQRSARRGWRAYQVRMAAQRLGEAAAALRRGRLREAFDRAARVLVHAWRYVRGYPRPRVRREPLAW